MPPPSFWFSTDQTVSLSEAHLGQTLTLPRQSISMPTGAWPEPTPSELATLTFHVTAWGDRSRLQQSVCLAVLRGHRRVPAIARYLRVGQRDVNAALADLVGSGLLWNGPELMFR